MAKGRLSKKVLFSIYENRNSEQRASNIYVVFRVMIWYSFKVILPYPGITRLRINDLILKDWATHIQGEDGVNWNWPWIEWHLIDYQESRVPVTKFSR